MSQVTNRLGTFAKMDSQALTENHKIVIGILKDHRDLLGEDQLQYFGLKTSQPVAAQSFLQNNFGIQQPVPFASASGAASINSNNLLGSVSTPSKKGDFSSTPELTFGDQTGNQTRFGLGLGLDSPSPLNGNATMGMPSPSPWNGHTVFNGMNLLSTYAAESSPTKLVGTAAPTSLLEIVRGSNLQLIPTTELAEVSYLIQTELTNRLKNPQEE